MKLKINKKSIKQLSQSQELNGQQTPKIAGGLEPDNDAAIKWPTVSIKVYCLSFNKTVCILTSIAPHCRN